MRGGQNSELARCSSSHSSRLAYITIFTQTSIEPKPQEERERGGSTSAALDCERSVTEGDFPCRRCAAFVVEDGFLSSNSEHSRPEKRKVVQLIAALPKRVYTASLCCATLRPSRPRPHLSAGRATLRVGQQYSVPGSRWSVSPPPAKEPNFFVSRWKVFRD